MESTSFAPSEGLKLDPENQDRESAVTAFPRYARYASDDSGPTISQSDPWDWHIENLHLCIRTFKPKVGIYDTWILLVLFFFTE